MLLVVPWARSSFKRGAEALEEPFTLCRRQWQERLLRLELEGRGIKSWLKRHAI